MGQHVLARPSKSSALICHLTSPFLWPNQGVNPTGAKSRVSDEAANSLMRLLGRLLEALRQEFSELPFLRLLLLKLLFAHRRELEGCVITPRLREEETRPSVTLDPKSAGRQEGGRAGARKERLEPSLRCTSLIPNRRRNRTPCFRN